MSAGPRLPPPRLLLRVNVTDSLVWSEYCFLICIALALVLVVVPHDWPLPGRRAIRHLPLLATLPLAILSIAGRRLSTPSMPYPPGRASLSILMPLILLGIWIVIGSAHARWVEGLQATFLNLGLYIIAAPAAALIVANSAAPFKLANSYLQLIQIGAVAMALGLVAVFGHRELYHEQIFMLIPPAVAVILNRQHRGVAWLGFVFIVGTALLSKKNTSYIIALMSSVYSLAFLWLNVMKRASTAKQLWMHYLAFTGVLLIAAAGCYLLYFREEYLPSGNTEFRSFTYRAAWQQFLQSPLWGTSFSEESIREFTLYTIGIARNRLPTHSDIMDLLANGGLLAIGLWLWSYVRIGTFAYSRVLSLRHLHYPWAPHVHTFAAISLAAIVVYAFNPILLQPEMAFLTWTTLGFLVGLAASCDPQAYAGNATDIAHYMRHAGKRAASNQRSPS
jgi:hypothetical protein